MEGKVITDAAAVADVALGNSPTPPEIKENPKVITFAIPVTILKAMNDAFMREQEIVAERTNDDTEAMSSSSLSIGARGEPRSYNSGPESYGAVRTVTRAASVSIPAYALHAVGWAMKHCRTEAGRLNQNDALSVVMDDFRKYRKYVVKNDEFTITLD